MLDLYCVIGGMDFAPFTRIENRMEMVMAASPMVPTVTDQAQAAVVSFKAVIRFFYSGEKSALPF